jgi:hypothetical protein
MGKRLSTKHKKLNKDKAKAYSTSKKPKADKVARLRSTRAKAKKNFRMV